MFRWIQKIFSSEAAGSRPASVTAQNMSVGAGGNISNSHINIGLNEEKIGATLDKKKLKEQIELYRAQIINLRNRMKEPTSTNETLLNVFGQEDFNKINRSMTKITNSFNVWDWSVLHIKLGISLASLANLNNDDKATFKEALDAFRESVKHGLEGCSPNDYITAKTNIGYVTLRMRSSEYYLEGVNALSEAIELIDPEANPEQWCFAQHMRGFESELLFSIDKNDINIINLAKNSYLLAQNSYAAQTKYDDAKLMEENIERCDKVLDWFDKSK